MSESFQKNQQIILDYERKFASELAVKVVEKPALTIWRIIMPLLLIYHAVKLKEYKQDISIFTQGVMKSKLLALGSAYNELRSNLPSHDYLHSLEVGEDSTTPNMKLFITRQKAEVELIKSHYKKLLKSSGTDYESLLRNVYKNRGQYRNYLLKLEKTEQDIQDSILKIHHPGSVAREMSLSMQLALKEMRKEEIKRVFG
ncbi:NF038143 family protein [Desulfonatronovibrio magnus]|uniref:NF038143 family protein n=1 Tax=Desulfonatronovibrio magnus TaxID=698827 RepID=UPI0005EB3380|nr:NF038143 family protein [Desulfonatronovibrio magnus]